MSEKQQHVYEQLEDMMNRLALAGLVIAALVVALVALLEAI